MRYDKNIKMQCFRDVKNENVFWKFLKNRKLQNFDFKKVTFCSITIFDFS